MPEALRLIGESASPGIAFGPDRQHEALADACAHDLDDALAVQPLPVAVDLQLDHAGEGFCKPRKDHGRPCVQADVMGDLDLGLKARRRMPC